MKTYENGCGKRERNEFIKIYFAIKNKAIGISHTQVMR